MNKIICDVCVKNEASREYKIKIREKGHWSGYSRRAFYSSSWGDLEEIDICGECAEKLLNLKYLDSDGFHRPPEKKA